MKYIALAAFFAALLAVMTPAASALPAPSVTFIPSEFSANSSLIMIVNPGATDPMSIVWVCYDCAFYRGSEYAGYGSVPKVGNKWYCYFSNTDNASNCGPVPFTATTYGYSPYTFDVYSMDQYGDTSNRSLSLNTGGVVLNINTTVLDSSVYATVWPNTAVSGVTYKVYSADTLDAVPGRSGSLEYYVPISGYRGNITLDYKDYFIEFKTVAAGGDFGGRLIKVSLKQPGVPIDGGIVESEDIDVGPVELDVLINKNQRFEQSGFEIANLGNLTIPSLSVSVPSHLSNYISVNLSSDTIGPNGHIFFTVALHNIQNAMNISTNANLESNNTFIKNIPISAVVSVINECQDSGGDCVVPAGELTISPMTWSGEFLTGIVESKDFIITNLGNTTITNFSYTSTIGSAIDDVEFPSSVVSHGTGHINVSLRSSSPGSYVGTLTISTEIGSKVILIAASFYEDISDEISEISGEFDSFKNNLTSDQYSMLSDVIDSIESNINSAETNIGYENYAVAKEKYGMASAAFDALSQAVSSGGGTAPPPSIDMGLVIMIAGAAIAAAVAYLVIKIVIKKMKGRRGREEKEFEDEEEFDEESEF